MTKRIGSPSTSGKDYALRHFRRLGLPPTILALLNLEDFARQNPACYQHYPALFSQAFPEVDAETVDLLSAAGFLYYRSIMFLDSFMDGDAGAEQDERARMLPIVMSTCQEEAIKLLSNVFPLASPFWRYWNQRRFEYLKAYRDERKLNAAGRFDPEAYYEIADNKAAFGKIAIDSLFMATTTRRPKLREELLEAHRLFSIGLQLLDDFQDFAEDARTGQVNYLQHALDRDLRRDGLAIETDPAVRHKLMYLRGIAHDALDRAEKYFNCAAVTLEFRNIEVGFRDLILDNLETVRHTRRQIDQYLQIVEARVELFGQRAVPAYRPADPAPAAFATPADRLFDQILIEADRCFPELAHLMYLGADEGFDNPHPVHVGAVFQRAILTDCLADYGSVAPATSPVHRLIDDQVHFLMENRTVAPVPGWSYFPTVREIAPDADDLGQVTQCLVRCDRPELVEEYCLPPARFLSEHNFSEEAGAYETWLVPRQGRTALQEIQEDFNLTKWGKGPDPEVVANFLYGCHLADHQLPTEQRRRCVDYLLSNRHTEGHWESRWYHGPYYGTYVCTRYLTAIGAPDFDAAATREFLYRNQRADGSWDGSPLCTALAVLSLELLAPRSAALRRGVRYLITTVERHPERLVGEAFIVPRAGRPQRSRTLTLAYVLKALARNQSAL